MYVKNADELRMMIKENPEETPSAFLRDDSFAAKCYDRGTVRELRAAFNRDADPEDCDQWGLSSSEWKENIEMALVARIAVEKMLTISEKNRESEESRSGVYEC